VIREAGFDIDTRDEETIVEQVLLGRAGYVPEWVPGERTPGTAVARIAGRYLATVLQRLNQVPLKQKLAFLDTAGVRLVPAQAARAPIVFVMAKNAAPGRIPAGAAVAAPPPKGQRDPIMFETEQAIGATTARLQQVVSLWPGRDEYIDHSAKILAGEPIRLFGKSELTPVAHELFISHGTLLALSGEVDVRLELELHEPSSENLRVRWQFWNGTVWRDFLDVTPACLAGGAPTLDSTDGLQFTGQVQLKASCADAKPRDVAGVNGFWIRGQLDEPLPPNPDATLPSIESIRISSIIAEPLVGTLEASDPYDDERDAADLFTVYLRNAAGEPLVGATVQATSADGSRSVVFTPVDETTPAAAGVYEAEDFVFGASYRFRVEFNGESASMVNAVLLESTTPAIDLVFHLDGLAADSAFFDAESLDVSKPFFPFGLLPQPGSTFYVAQDAVLSRPGAAVRLYVATTQSTLDQASIESAPAGGGETVVVSTPSREPLEHVVAWEYWNSRKWVPFLRSSDTDPTRDFTKTEIIDFTVPDDLARTTVNGKEAFWIRAKVLRGGFGVRTTVTFDDGRQGTNTFTFVVQQPPCVADLRMGFAWQYGPFPPDAVVTYNDFRFENHTEDAIWPGRTFQPFTRVADVMPVVYLGLDAKPPVDRAGIYFDVDEERGALRGPALQWEFFDGVAWRVLTVDDETERLRAAGIVSFLAPPTLKAAPRFGRSLYWFRARLKEDGPPGEATVRGIFLNAVWASQRRTIRNEVLGTSDGTPDQVFAVAEAPVLPGEIIEVREVAGPRAQVEWRQVVLDVTGGDTRALAPFEEWLALDGVATEFIYGDVRLRRERDKRVSEVWVRWTSRPHLFFSTAADRHYAIDAALGRVLFGDGENGRVPPPGAALLIREFATGGGSIGNVAVRTIDQLIAEVPGAEQVFNARAAEGGADTETLEAFARRGPDTIRHRGRAITTRDYETMAREASASVAFVRAIPTRNPAGRPLPGWVTLIVIPGSEEPRPMPSAGLRRAIREYIGARAPADLAAGERIIVIGPDYFPIDVTATIAPAVSASPGDVERAARDAIARFLHPLKGGPRGRGWDLGRDVFLSDLAAVLEQVPGVDYVEELALLREGVPAGERVDIADDRIAVAGTVTLTLRTETGARS
jgi:uncharacterized phage protein gp47/JayE